ncbi:MAG: hypothetical protein J6X66_14210 [Lachnospiraceae bacterium]|nr:hypothetical protein [Lachnospiraceae bacterium]
MKNKIVKILAVSALSAALMAGCGEAEAAADAAETKVAAEENEETETTETSSDEFAFSDLQDNFVILNDCYNKVEELYNNDAVAQDDNVESLLTEAKGIIDEMGELTEADFSSSEDMIKFNDTMADMIDALGAVVDKMQPAEAAEEAPAEEASDVSFVDGFYATDGDAEYVLAFYESTDGDVAYITDGKDEAFAVYTVENAVTDEGNDYLLVTVGDLTLGYVEDGDDIYLVDDEGNIYGAARLTEEEAAQFVADAE